MDVKRYTLCHDLQSAPRKPQIKMKVDIYMFI